MKTTLDIPDTLYREFKAKTATNGEKSFKKLPLAEVFAVGDKSSDP